MLRLLSLIFDPGIGRRRSATALPFSFKLPEGMGLQNLQRQGAGGNNSALILTFRC